jgi:hypothetical protein
MVLAEFSIALRHRMPVDRVLVRFCWSDAPNAWDAPTRHSAAFITGNRAVELTRRSPSPGMKCASSRSRTLPLSGKNLKGSRGLLLPSGRTWRSSAHSPTRHAREARSTLLHIRRALFNRPFVGSVVTTGHGNPRARQRARGIRGGSEHKPMRRSQIPSDGRPAVIIHD